MDAQRWIFIPAPALECVTCEKKDNLFIPVRAMPRNFRTVRGDKKIIKKISIIYQTIYINNLEFKTKDKVGVIFKWGRMSLSWKMMR